MAGTREHIVCSGATVLIDSVSMGFTSGETTIKHSIGSVDIMANQSHLVIKSVKNKESGSVVFSMLEMKRENLKTAYETNQAIATSGDHKYVYVGGDQDIDEHVIIIYGEGEDNKLRKFTIHKAVRDGDADYKLDINAATVMALTYKMLGDLSKAEGKQLFEIDDDTSTAYDKDTGL